MARTSEPALRWRLFAATLLAFLLAATALPAASRERSPCQGLTGEERRQCSHDQVLALTEANRRAAEARRAAMPGAPLGPSSAPAASGGSGVRGAQGDPGAPPSILTNADGRPVVVRDKGRALLTLVTFTSSGRERRSTLSVVRGCNGQTTSNASLTFDKACHADVLHNTAIAQPLFERSCSEGDPSGCYMLTTYLTARKDRDRVLSLLQDACSDGHGRACSEMAEAYRTGDGVARDAAQMRAYYDQGCTAGNTYSCAWMQGKIDADCPHGFRSYRVDFNRHTNRVFCVTPTGGLSRTEVELAPSAAEVADMKSYGEYMRTHKATPVGDVMREALRGQPTDNSPCGPDSRGYDGKPIAGSGCAGHTVR